MESSIAGAWTLVVGVVAGSLLFGYSWCKYYQDKFETEKLVTFVASVGISLSLAILAVVPIDIALVDSIVDSSTGQRYSWATQEVVDRMTGHMTNFVYVLYGLAAFFAFVAIPFAYFYYEELEEDDVDVQSQKDRILAALKYTLVTATIALICLVVGLLLKNKSEPLDLDWFKKLLSGHGLHNSLGLLIAIMILLGQIPLLTYLAPGLSLLPLSLLQTNRLSTTESQMLDGELALVREQISTLRARQSQGGFRIGNLLGGARREEQEIAQLEARQLRLSQRQDRLNASSQGWIAKCWNILRPFQVLLGGVGILLSLLTIASLLTTLVDKVSHSVCGGKCGYLLGTPSFPNALNWILVKTASYFPTDFIFFATLFLFIFAALNYGVTVLGIRILWVKLFDVRKRGTLPQGLLLACLVIMFGLMGSTYTVNVLAPQYVQYGDQKYCNRTIDLVASNATISFDVAEIEWVYKKPKKGGEEDPEDPPENPPEEPDPKEPPNKPVNPPKTRDCTNHTEFIVPCDIYGPTSICTPTATSQILNRILVQSPMLGIMFFISQWIFVGVFILSLVMAVVKGARVGSVVLLDEEDDEEVPIRVHERRPVERRPLLARE